MGFKLFTESGTFNPADHGLKAGDTIYVVVVGGGGGGGVTYAGSGGNTSLLGKGGTGGTSSFGSYLTALGGAGGVPLNVPQATQGGALGGQNSNAGGGGAGGWLPELPQLNCVPAYSAKVAFANEYSANPFCSSNVFKPINTGGIDGEDKAVGSYYGTSSNVVRQDAVTIYGVLCDIPLRWTVQAAYINLQPQKRHSVCGGMGSYAHYYYYAPSQSIQNYDYFTPLGGVGYGAGGASCGRLVFTSNNGSFITYYNLNGGFGGNSGELKKSTLILNSIQGIPVSIGGGGSGAATTLAASINNGTTAPDVSTANTKPGNDGAVSACGTSTLDAASGNNAGGYGTNPCGGFSTTTSNTNSTSFFYGGGGGASGCVAIWW